MRKSEIQLRNGRPAVNVKVYGSTWQVQLPLDLGSSGPIGGTMVTAYTDPEFTHDWLAEHESELEWTFDAACQDGWEMLQSDAEEIFGDGVKVYSDGRSGGWAVVEGLSDPETWDAIALGRWAKFARYARVIANDVPRAMVWLAYANLYEPMRDAAEAHETYTMGKVYSL